MYGLWHDHHWLHTGDTAWEWIAKYGHTFYVRAGFDERVMTVEPHHVKVRREPNSFVFQAGLNLFAALSQALLATNFDSWEKGKRCFSCSITSSQAHLSIRNHFARSVILGLGHGGIQLRWYARRSLLCTQVHCVANLWKRRNVEVRDRPHF